MWVDGTPPMAPDLRTDWVRTCTEVYDDLVAGVPRPPLRSYGATDPGEFFAVATHLGHLRGDAAARGRA